MKQRAGCPAGLTASKRASRGDRVSASPLEASLAFTLYFSCRNAAVWGIQGSQRVSKDPLAHTSGVRVGMFFLPQKTRQLCEGMTCNAFSLQFITTKILTLFAQQLLYFAFNFIASTDQQGAAGREDGLRHNSTASFDQATGQ